MAVRKRRVRRARLVGGAIYAASALPMILGSGRRRRRVRHRGRGFWGKVWKGIKKANKWLKDTKVISNALKGIDPSWAATAASAGYGRRRRRRHRGHGMVNLAF